MISTGLDLFLKKEYKRFQKKSLAVLCNQASVDSRLTHIRDSLFSLRPKLDIACFLGPQHGIRGEKQDNMVESTDFTDSLTQKPVYSLYSHTRIPTPSMLKNVDVILVDLQDIGTRIYTFMYTMANCMIMAKQLGIKVVVLDRPNPLGGSVTEGNLLEEGFESFVGQYPMVTRHGLTIGELALYFNETFEINCELEVIPLKNWSRNQTFESWGRDWTPPSPNIPRWLSAVTFPGTVHFEGTNISEGRGTTMPFEWIGAPFIEPGKLVRALNKYKLQGVFFREIFFQPTYQKWLGSVCGGVQIHVINFNKFNAFETGVILLYEMAKLGERDFEWKKPPYEYEYERAPIDLISGTDRLRKVVESQKGLKSFLLSAREDSDNFKKQSRPFKLY